MVIICQQCNSRLQLDDGKIPARAFTVRCPKCQHLISAQPPAAGADHSALGAGGDLPAEQCARFVRPKPAPAFRLEQAGGAEADDPVAADRDEVTRLLSGLLQRALTAAASEASLKSARRPFNDRRVLVCAEAEHRYALARVLVENGYEAFVAEDTTQAIERMREDQMDVVVLESEFDPQEQGAAFIKREISALRPAARRRVFFVLLAADARTNDPHTAFVRHANFVLNPAEIEEFPQALERAMRDFNELYRNFNKASELVAG